MRVGIFGGTFDPPHLGHVLPAIDVAEGLGLDCLLWLPAAQQPLKIGRSAAPSADRLAMVALAAALHPSFSVDPVEIERAGLSYTVDTLDTLSRRYPGADLHFVAGMDVLDTFARWREPERIMQLAGLVLMRRGEPTPHEKDRIAALVGGGGVRTVETRRVDVSSTEVRARVAAGKSIRGFVPDAVADYVRRAALYR